MCDYFYLDVSLILSEKLDSILPIYFKGSIEESLRNIFGEIGGLTTLDLIKFDRNINRGILRVPVEFYVKVRVALTSITKFQDIDCYFKVNNSSSSLLSLLHSNIIVD